MLFQYITTTNNNNNMDRLTTDNRTTAVKMNLCTPLLCLLDTFAPPDIN